MEDVHCFFDAYVLLTQETIDILIHPDRQERMRLAHNIHAYREILTIDPAFLDTVHEVPPLMRYLQQQLRQVRPYILIPAVAQMAIDLVEKADRTPVPYVPFLKLPFWIEFQGVALGGGDEQFVAILSDQRA